MRLLLLKNSVYLWRARLVFVLVIILLTPIGFYTKFYQGAGEKWVHLYAGDILYPIWWYFLLLVIVPRFNPYFLAALNLTFDILGEFSQLIDTPLLESIRANFIGRTVIGSGFDSDDFIYYFIGNALALIAYLILVKLLRLKPNES